MLQCYAILLLVNWKAIPQLTVTIKLCAFRAKKPRRSNFTFMDQDDSVWTWIRFVCSFICKQFWVVVFQIIFVHFFSNCLRRHLQVSGFIWSE